MQLRVTDGTTTVDLSGGTTGITGCTYFPLAPSSGEATVGEQAELVCRGTAAAIRTALNSIERLCEAASRRHATGKGTRVYVEYKPVDSDSLYRSELFGGRLVYSEEPGARRFGETNPAIKLAFVFERAPWWEGAEVELQLSAQGQAAATGGRTITNNGTDNWVQIAAAQVAGTLPGPVRLRLKNTSGAARNYREFHIGINAYASPSTFGGVFQGEADLSGSGSTTNANSSGGYYRTFSVPVTENLVASWLLTSAQMSAGGRWCRLLARMASYDVTKAVRVRPVIRDFYGLVTLWEGAPVWLPTFGGYYEMVDLGSFPLPPGAYSADYAQCRLILKMQASASTTLSLDYVQILPMDGYRRITQVGMQIANNDFVEFDEIEGRYTSVEGGLRHPIHVASGAPGLYLQPGMLQQIRVLHDEGFTSPIANTFSAQVWYRPRRSTV